MDWPWLMIGQVQPTQYLIIVKNRQLHIFMKKVLTISTMLSTWLACVSQTNVTLQSSNLPIFIINTKGQTIANEPKVNVNLKVIYNGKGKINNVSDKTYHYNNNIGIEVRGNSSQSYPQQQYGFETRDSVKNANLDYPLLGMPADNDWVLYAPYNDISLLRNVLTYKIWNQMDHWGPRTRYCEVILNGEYRGIYILTESIKRGGKRVDVAKMTSADTVGTPLTGGYIMKIDKKNNTADKSFVSKYKSSNNQDVVWLYHYPKSEDIRPKQEAYIHSFIDSMETAIQSANFADTSVGYAKYISTQSFIDYLIITEFTKNTDGYKASAYFHKEKRALDGTKGKFKAGPVWDYNFALGNASFCQGGTYTDWMYVGCNPATLPMPKLWSRLLQDPNFANQVKCRYQSLRTSLLSTSSINSYLDSYALDTLAQAQVRHFTKWKILGTNPGNFNAYTVASYSAELQTLKTWIANRLTWMDNNLGGTCSVVSSGTDVVQQQSATGIDLYPNPFTEVLSIQAPARILELELYNAQGKQVYRKEGMDKNEITLSAEIVGLPAGLYAVKCKTDLGIQTRLVYKR